MTKQIPEKKEKKGSQTSGTNIKRDYDKQYSTWPKQKTKDEQHKLNQYPLINSRVVEGLTVPVPHQTLPA